LRTWLAVSSVTICLAIVAVFVLGTLHARDLAIETARNSAENLAASLYGQASDTFEAVDAVLLTLSERVEMNGTAAAQRIRLRDSMAALVTNLPALRSLGVFDEHGRSLSTNLSATPGWWSVTHQPSFQYHRTHPGSSLHISGPARDQSDHVYEIFVSRRIDRADGSFGGVVAGLIALDYFSEHYADVDVGRLGTITLYADDATIMARQPCAFIGRRVPQAGMFNGPYRYQQAGTYIRRAHLDRVLRLFAFRRLAHFPLSIQVALAQSEYLGNWWTHAVRSALALVFILALVAGLAIGLGVQIGRRQRAEDELAHLALLDGLTGIGNRRHFDAVLEREWRAAARDDLALALLMIDVDNFKAYNDHYGHQRGDDVLVSIARAAAASIVRPSDVVARYGGEEFGVILPATSVMSAVHVAERVRAAVAALAVPHAGSPLGIASVSIGVAGLVPPSGESNAVPLVTAADAALYDAKRLGRNRTSVMLGFPGPIVPAASAARATPPIGT
jgi:diguanylate cyclase (GGDEF)-like protein